MTAIPEGSSVSRFARFKECLRSEATRYFAQGTALGCSALASFLLIPIKPLKGAAVNTFLFLLMNKAYSASGDYTPRTWKQIGLGLVVSGAAGACAPLLHDRMVYLFAVLGLAAGVWITYNNSLWRCCDALRNRCFPAPYNQLSPEGGTPGQGTECIEHG